MGLINSRYYHVKLLSPWDLEYDIYIVGTVSKLTINEIEEYDIRATYFTKYNIGIAGYLASVKDSTPIYYGYLITSKSAPIEYDSNTKIFIPESIINSKASETYEYLVGSIPKFSIIGNTRYFKLATDESNFEESAIKEMISSLKDTENLIADSLVISYTSDDSLTTQDTIDIFNSNKLALLTENNQNKIQEKLITESKQRELYEKRIEMEASKTNYETSKKIYDNLVKQLAADQTAIIEENLILDGVKEIFTAMCEKVKNGELNPANFQTFQEMYEYVKNALSTT